MYGIKDFCRFHKLRHPEIWEQTKLLTFFISCQRATCGYKHSKSSAQHDCLSLQSIFTKASWRFRFCLRQKTTQTTKRVNA
ncbi:hypothetical protein [Vibrio ostreicida]|uniref:hypothetical protein n=1 Tax=Vibrio ostreicida TaxID=526588 RepID=UPI0009711F97